MSGRKHKRLDQSQRYQQQQKVNKGEQFHFGPEEQNVIEGEPQKKKVKHVRREDEGNKYFYYC
jgi:hypothetical protein